MKEVEDLNQAFYAAIESADLDRMSEIWVDDVPDHLVAMCVHPGWPLLSGRGEVLRSWALIMANTPYIQFVLTDVQTTVLGNGRGADLRREHPDGGRRGRRGRHGLRGRAGVVATNTFVKTAGGWRLWHHHGSPVLQTGDDEEEEEAS